jgi:DNA-binding response OmpR family regulator
MTDRKRILIVEDEPVLAMLIEDMVEELGYQPVGPAMTIEAALALSAADALDGAILDMNLGGGVPSTPIAEKLKSRGVPFIFATGYSSEQASARTAGTIGDTIILRKPFSINALSKALGLVIR